MASTRAPAAAAAAARRDPLAAGARRATGERQRRTRTPLLPSVDETAVAPAAAAGVDPALAGHDPLETEVMTTPDPVPTLDSEVPVESVESVESVEPIEPASSTPARPRKHRPHPTPAMSTPSKGALRRSGSRVDLQGRTADGPAVAQGAVAASGRAAVRRSLRVVPDLDLTGSTATRAAPPPVGPDDDAATVGPEATPVPAAGTIRPGIEDLVQAGVAALRTVASASGVAPEEVERQVASTLAFLRRRLSGDFTIDEFGFDADFTDHFSLPLLRPLYRSWFRVEVRGVENLPAEGGGLVVANHSGTIPVDSLMTQVAVHDEHPQHRHLRMLGADLVFSTPVMGQLARKSGSTLATSPDAERLLRGGELVGVWPEGFKGVGKPFSERYKLQRFGRGGFVSAAISAGVPIIPCSIVGAEEIYPLLGNIKALARLVGAPYAPVTPTWPLLGPLGLIPLPSKWIIEFGVPVQTAHLGVGAADDPMLVFDLTDQIRETIQQTLYSLLMQRRSVFF